MSRPAATVGLQQKLKDQGMDLENWTGAGGCLQVDEDGLFWVFRSAYEPSPMFSPGSFVSGTPVYAGIMSTMFISARAWIEGSNKAKSIMNMSTIQKAAVSYANLNGLRPDQYHEITMEILVKESLLSQDTTLDPDGLPYTLKPTKSTDEVWVHSLNPEHQQEFEQAMGM